MKRNGIVMIDDEHTKVQYFEKALVDVGYDVKVIKDINTAWDYFATKREEVCAIVLDLLLPKPKLLREVIASSVVGVHVQKHLFDQLKSTRQIIPIAILTQLSKGDNPEIFEQLLRQQQKEFPDWPLQTWMKIGLDPDDFATQFAAWLKCIGQ